MKVLFVLPNVAVGGVERVRLRLIDRFQADGAECLLALRHSRGELIGRARALVDIHELAPRGMHQFIPALAKLIRQQQPTHIVTAFSDVAVLTWVAMRLAGSKARWVHSVHNTHSRVGSRRGPVGILQYRLENRMAGFAYRRADAVVAVSEGVREEILGRYRVDGARVTTIYNPVVEDDQLNGRRSDRDAGKPCRIVALGRLVHQKGYDVLVQAMSMVAGEWRLDIWGEGPERARLERMIEEKGLSGRIHLRGYTSDPFEVMRAADCFVMSSRHEGLPATLIEALACQCQIVATDCPHGPGEILRYGELGQMVPTEAPNELAAAIARVVRNEVHVDHRELVARAADFACTRAGSRWTALLEKLQ